MIDTTTLYGAAAMDIDSVYVMVNAMGEVIRRSRQALAMQWFVGNCFIIALAAAFGLLLWITRKPPKTDDASGGSEKINMSTKKFAVITAIFIVGLVASQIILQLVGILAWCALFGIGVTIYLKGKSSWFVRRNHTIPTGWAIMFFLAVAVMILIFNTFPTIVAEVAG